MGHHETLPTDLCQLVDTWSTHYWVQFDPDSPAFTPTFTLAQLEKLLDYVN